MKKDSLTEAIEFYCIDKDEGSHLTPEWRRVIYTYDIKHASNLLGVRPEEIYHTYFTLNRISQLCGINILTLRRFLYNTERLVDLKAEFISPALALLLIDYYASKDNSKAMMTQQWLREPDNSIHTIHVYRNGNTPLIPDPNAEPVVKENIQ